MQEPLITIQDIFSLIEQAKRLEDQTQSFQSLMDKKAQQLHFVIGLNDQHPGDCLLQFAVEYIEMAPRLIECVAACAAIAKTQDQFSPFIQTAMAYFSPPADCLRQTLDMLLVSAYLSHRLLEEMYENNRSTKNSELCAIESTEANLLAHQLIGEQFANELDELIERQAKQIAGSADYFEVDLQPFVNQAQHQSWQWMRKYWQNLLTRNHIEFHFSYRNMF